MSLVRRARTCAPDAEGKREAAEGGCHLDVYDISFPRFHATAIGFACGFLHGTGRRACGSVNRAGSHSVNHAGYIFHNGHFFESSPLPGAPHVCTLMGSGLRRTDWGGTRYEVL